MDVLKKILNVVIDIFIVLVVIISAIIAIISVSSQKTGVPDFFGYVPFTVKTDSMSPAFNAGDMIVSKKLETQGKDADYEFKEGDVVTFWTTIKDNEGHEEKALNTHRIYKYVPNLAGEYNAYETKGDNNMVADKDIVSRTQIVAIWSSGEQEGIKIKKVGTVLEFLRKPSGFFIAVVIPMIIFFIYELIRFITNFMNYNKEKAKEAALEAAKGMLGDDASGSSGLSEEQKAQAILEYLEKQKSESSQAEDNLSAPETEQPATEDTEAVSEPEQEEAVSEADDN